jgi:hypothetical protein
LLGLLPAVACSQSKPTGTPTTPAPSQSVTPSPTMEAPASDAETQVRLRNSLVTALVFYIDNGTYVATPAQFHQIEPRLEFVSWTSSLKGKAIRIKGTSTTILMVERASTGTYFCISGDSNEKPGFGKAPSFGGVDAFAKCRESSW